MSTDSVCLGWHEVSGTPLDVGIALGRTARAVVHSRLVKSAVWNEITDERHDAACRRMFDNTRAAYPDILEEIRGLALGLELPLEQVFAWNCRGDLLADTPDGCTTVQIPGPPAILAHNEDGLPFFDGHCFIASVKPTGKTGFWSFCYPGSICGHTFALNEYDLAVTANNLRLKGVAAQIPRMVLARAMLNCRSIDDAIGQTGMTPACGGFHFTLAQPGKTPMTGLEIGGGLSVRRTITHPSVHANHGLWGPFQYTGQIVTRSSRDRQIRGDTMLRNGERKVMNILRDRQDHKLPIWRRAPDDPDNENTLASVVFKIRDNTVNWTIYGGASHSPAYEKSESNV